MSPSEKIETLDVSGDSAHELLQAKEIKEFAHGKSFQRLSVKLDFIQGNSTSELSAAHPHVLFYPLHYEVGYSYPLLVWLHGRGGDERQVMRVMPKLSMRNYVAVAPQGFPQDQDKQESFCRSSKVSSNIWNSLDVTSIINGSVRSKVQYDWQETDEMLTEAEQRIFDCISIAKKRANIASNRIFLAGFGTGGTLAMRLGLLYPESFAGVASLGGAFPQARNVMHRWVAARDLAVFLGFGQNSTTFSPNTARQTLELLHTAGVPTVAKEYVCGQELVPQMLQDLNHWMMNLVCGG